MDRKLYERRNKSDEYVARPTHSFEAGISGGNNDNRHCPKSFDPEPRHRFGEQQFLSHPGRFVEALAGLSIQDNVSQAIGDMSVDGNHAEGNNEGDIEMGGTTGNDGRAEYVEKDEDDALNTPRMIGRITDNIIYNKAASDEGGSTKNSPRKCDRLDLDADSLHQLRRLVTYRNERRQRMARRLTHDAKLPKRMRAEEFKALLDRDVGYNKGPKGRDQDDGPPSQFPL